MADCTNITDTLDYSVSTRLQSKSMGIGKLGSDSIIHKRKFRWLFGINFCRAGGIATSKYVPPHFVKVASRPDISIEETEVNFLNEKTWIPGKPTWEAITVTYLDVSTADNSVANQGLWDWLASVYDFTSTCRWMSSNRSSYAGIGTLVLLDGCGNELEEWQFGDMWPTSIKFGDLDYSSSDLVEIELTLRYSQVQYKSWCPNFTPEGCPCVSC